MCTIIQILGCAWAMDLARTLLFTERLWSALTISRHDGCVTFRSILSQACSIFNMRSSSSAYEHLILLRRGTASPRASPNSNHLCSSCTSSNTQAKSSTACQKINGAMFKLSSATILKTQYLCTINNALHVNVLYIEKFLWEKTFRQLLRCKKLNARKFSDSEQLVYTRVHMIPY